MAETEPAAVVDAAVARDVRRLRPISAVGKPGGLAGGKSARPAGRTGQSRRHDDQTVSPRHMVRPARLRADDHKPVRAGHRDPAGQLDAGIFLRLNGNHTDAETRR